MLARITVIGGCALGLAVGTAGSSAAERADSGDTRAAIAWQRSYDDAGRIIEVRGPGGKNTQFRYETDQHQRLKRLTKTLPDGTRVTLDYDAFQRPASMTDAAGKVRYEYDGFNRLTAVRRDGFPALLYGYDTLDRITSVSVGNQLTAQYAYDFLGRLARMETPAGTIAYEFQSGQGRIIRTLPNGIRTIWDYRPDGKLATLAHAAADNRVLAQFSYDYRPDGLISRIGEFTPQGERTLGYEYDLGQRLTAVTDSRNGRTEYRYDKLGNRTEWQAAGAPPIASSYDWAGRMVSHNGQPCAHDSAGNLDACAGVAGNSRFEYNGANLLKTATTAQGVIIQYQYDGDDRLIARIAGNDKTTFVVDPFADGWRPLLISRPDGRKTAFVWEGNTPLAAITGSEAQFYLQDHLGSVRYLTDRKGQIVQQLDYDPFGVFQQKPGENYWQPGFAGLFFDPKAAVYLTRARAYEPSLGRFLQRDPEQKVPFGSPKDLDMYVYCGSDPVNFFDRNGVSAQPYDKSSKFPPQMYREPLFDFFGNSIGRIFGLNWFGRNVTGGERYAHEKDPWGEFKLGDTTVRPNGIWDAAARKHDIQYYIDVHFEKDTWVEVPSPGGGVEYYMSNGDVAGTNFRLFRDLVISQSMIAPFIKHGGRRKLPEGVTAVPLKQDLYSTLPINNLILIKHSPHNERKNKDDEEKTNARDLPGCIGLHCWGDGGGGLGGDYAGGFMRWPSGCMGPHCGDDGDGGPGGGGPDGGPQGPDRFSPMSPANVGGIYLRGAGKALGVLGPLEGVAVDANTGKLILLSQKQGAISLPPLRLDDIVTIFRSVYDQGQAPWVSIDPDPRDPEGPLMHVRHGPGTENTYVGWILFEADRVMKTYSLGYDNLSRAPLKSAVKDYRNLFDLGFSNVDGGHTSPIWERFWIVPAAVNRQQTATRQLTLLDVPLKVNTQRMEFRNGELVPAAHPEPSPEARTFSDWFTGHYDDIAREARHQPPPESGLDTPVPFYTELRRIALVAAIAETLRDQGVPLPAWMRDYPVKPVPVAATTPSIVVEASQTQRQSVVRDGQAGLLTQTRIQRIYGGVRLSPEDRAVHTIAAAPQAEALAPALARATVSTPLLASASVTAKGQDYQALALPGAETREVGARQLAATDLVVPVQAGRRIALTRHFHSFFQPADVFGGAWTLDLPRLEPQRLPVSRQGDETQYQTVYQLASPLNTWQGRFSKTGRVPELNATLLVPDTPGKLLGVGQTQNEQIGYPTQVLLFRDGRRWYFDDQGQLAGWTEAPLTVVYRRDPARRIQRIEGWYGDKLRADINLQYDDQGRLSKAKGSHGEEVTYRYDPAGAGLEVRDSRGVARYRHQNGLVTAIERDGQPLARFAYNERGQLQQEQWLDGQPLAYTPSATAQGVTVTAAQAGKPVETVHYDPAYQPVRRVLADGTRFDWQRRGDGMLETAVTLPEGERYVVTRSADGGQRAWQAPEGGNYAAEYDPAGRLIALSQGDRPLVHQQWRPDGQAGAATYETVAVRPEYRPDGLLNRVLVTPPAEQGPRLSRWLEIGYDERARPVAIADYTGAKIQVGYDQSGQLAELVSEQGDQPQGVRITRDAKGQVSDIATSWGYRQTHRYDAQTGELSRVDLRQGQDQAFIELERGRPRKMRQFDGGEWTVAYGESGLRDGRIKSLRTPLGLELNYAYAAADRLASVTVGDGYRVEYRYDPQGRLTAITQTPVR